MVAEVSTPIIPPYQYPHLNPSLLSANRLLPRILTNTGHSSCASSSSSSSCSSSPATTHTSNNSWSLKGQIITCKPDLPPMRRKKASRACGHCQKAHLTCDDGRPCLRCTKRGLSKTCADGVRKKAKYLSDYDDALLIRPRPPSKRVSEDILETQGCKKVKVEVNDQDCRLSISWAGLDLLDKAGMSSCPDLETLALGGAVSNADLSNQACALGGLDEWLARFENGDSASHGSPSNGCMSLETNINQVYKPSESRQRMQEWVERIDRLVEIRKLTMNITTDDEWMLKRNLDRSLMELERVMSLSGTPTMIWSTSGQILKVGDEFCMLTEWSREELIGRHIENVFEYESLEEYLELVESSMFPDDKSIRHQLRPVSRASKSSSHRLSKFSSSSPSPSSLSSSPSPSSVPLMSHSNSSNTNLNRSSSFSNDVIDAISSSSSAKSGRRTHNANEFNQNIKWFGIRKACGQESIGCSFCFKIRKDLFDCPSTIVGSFLPILTRTSYSDSSN